MDFIIRLICFGVLFITNSFHQIDCANFHKLQQRLLERAQQNLPTDDLVLSEVKEWVSNTIDRLSNRVEFISDQLEKAFVRQTILEHNQFLEGAAESDVTGLDRESPSYKVICASENGYEARQYQEALWVITFSDPGEAFLPAKLRCESKIQKYILGHNERGVKIYVTSPWLSKIVASEEGKHRQYIFLFYLPSAFQDDPPTPLDPMIFFDSISPKVYAFSNSYVIGQDAAWALHDIAISLLNQHHEQIVNNQYYLADYEAPFSKYSRNSEILILMENSNLPRCDHKVEHTPSPFVASYQDILESEESGDSSGLLSHETDYGIDIVDEIRTTPVQPSPAGPRVELRRSQYYLRKVVNGCTQYAIDETMTKLFSCRQSMADEVIFVEVPGDVLLRVARPLSFMGDQECGDSLVEILLKIPDWDSVESFQEKNMNNGITLYNLPSMLVYTANIPDQGGDPALSILETSMIFYFEMLDNISSRCLTDQELYIHGGLAYYPDMDQLWIPYMKNCWRMTGEDTDTTEEQPSGDDDLSLISSMADGNYSYSSGFTEDVI